MTTTKLLSNYAMPVAVCLALATPALANSGTISSLFDLTPVSDFVTDDGAAEHLVVTSKLMQLSQRIPAAACYEHFQIEKEQNAAFIGKGVALFDQILVGLEHGDPSLGLMKPETDKHVLEDLAAIHAVWDPLHTKLEKIAAGSTSDADILLLHDISKELVDLTMALMADVTAEYADPTVLVMGDAMQLDFAGRMPMMAQKMSKDLCMAMGNLKTDEVLADIAKTSEVFENTAAALRDGMPAVGLRAPKDPAIANAISDALNDWAAVAPVFDALVAGETLTKETETQVYFAMNDLTEKLDAIEQMFGESSKMEL